jgi:hypothetical protein
MATYRRRKGDYDCCWHFCVNCSDYPTRHYDELTETPTTGELCPECKVKHSVGTCRADGG